MTPPTLAGRPLKLSVLDHSPVADGSTAAEALHNSIDLARRADALGYERYWAAEHHALASHAGPAPEILIASVAARTSGIRVGSGGVLLHYYSPLKVVEVFSVLQALHPNRIDLGIGRSGGANSLESLALRRDAADDFDAKLMEMLAFFQHGFPIDHPFQSIPVMPSVPDAPPVWLLGSSPRSSAAAASLGLPYAFAHFINPGPTRQAVETYYARYRAGWGGREPRVIVGLGVYCADTEEEARRLYASHLLVRRRLIKNDIRPVPSADEAVKELRSGPDPLAGEVTEWPHYTVGTPEQVSAVVQDMARELSVDEFVVMNMIADHGARVRSFELLAEALELTPRQIPPVLPPAVEAPAGHSGGGAPGRLDPGQEP